MNSQNGPIVNRTISAMTPTLFAITVPPNRSAITRNFIVPRIHDDFAAGGGQQRSPTLVVQVLYTDMSSPLSLAPAHP